MNRATSEFVTQGEGQMFFRDGSQIFQSFLRFLLLGHFILGCEQKQNSAAQSLGQEPISVLSRNDLSELIACQDVQTFDTTGQTPDKFQSWATAAQLADRVPAARLALEQLSSKKYNETIKNSTRRLVLFQFHNGMLETVHTDGSQEAVRNKFPMLIGAGQSKSSQNKLNQA